MANFCSNCGSRLNPGARFCPNCGQQIRMKAAAHTDTTGGITIDAPEGSSVTISDTAPRIGSSATVSDTAPRIGSSATVPDTAPRKKRSFRSRLGTVLVIALLAEFFYAGFRNPGFFVNRPKDESQSVSQAGQTAGISEEAGTWNGSGNDAGSGDPTASSGAGNESPAAGSQTPLTFTIDGEEYVIPADYDPEKDPPVQATPENSPRNPRFIAIRYDESDYADTPVYSARVSEESPSAVLGGGIAADLNWWNLEDGPDEVIARVLPEKEDEETGDRMIGYDFSMGSGRHEFYGVITVTIPRHASDENEGGIMYFNEEAGEWERMYYEVSDDGASYVVYTDHFSTITELLFGKGREKLIDAFSENVFEEYNYKPSSLNPHAYVTEQELAEHQVYKIAPEMTRVTLVSLNDMCEHIATQSANAKTLVENLKKQEIPQSRTVMAMEEANFWYGLGDGSLSTTDYAVHGSEVAQALGPEASAVQYIKAFLMSPSVKSASKLSSFSSLVSKGGYILLAARVLYQCFNKDMTWGDVYRDNQWSLMGTFSSVCANLAVNHGYKVAAGISAFAAVAIFVCSTVYLALEPEGTWSNAINESDCFEEGTYHRYLQAGNSRICQGYTLYPDGRGFAAALNYIYETYHEGQSSFDQYSEYVTSIIDRYIDEFWDLPDEEVEKFINKDSWVWNKWERPKPNYVKEYKYRIRMMLNEKINPVLGNIAKKEYTDLVLAYMNYLDNIVIPLMNTTIYFVPRDMSLPMDEDPLHSPYLGWNGADYLQVVSNPEHGWTKQYQPASEFNDGAKELVFMPDGITERDIREYLRMKPIVKKHAIYLHQCTFYHYVQTGSPTRVTVKGVEEFGLEDTAGFVNWEKMEEKDGSYYVPVEYSNDSVVLADFLGDWELQYSSNPDHPYKNLTISQDQYGNVKFVQDGWAGWQAYKYEVNQNDRSLHMQYSDGTTEITFYLLDKNTLSYESWMYNDKGEKITFTCTYRRKNEKK